MPFEIKQTIGMLSRTLKLATYPMAYLTGYLEKRIGVFGALDPIRKSFYSLLAPSKSFLILPPETKSAS